MNDEGCEFDIDGVEEFDDGSVRANSRVAILALMKAMGFGGGDANGTLIGETSTWNAEQAEKDWTARREATIDEMIDKRWIVCGPRSVSIVD